MIAEIMVAKGERVTIPAEVLAEIGAKPGDTVTFRVTGPRTVELTRLPPGLTAVELIERYPIEGPIDENEAREAWQAEAAKEVFGQ